MIPRRIVQFVEAGRPPSEADWAIARAWLAPGLLACFSAQHPRDVMHAAGTARWLLERGHDDADLIAAALLHDVGKGQQRRLDRVAWVVTGALGVAPRAASPESRFEVRRALSRTSVHSAVGADLLRKAGASERCIGLTLRHHESAGTDPLLDLLQRADAAS